MMTAERASVGTIFEFATQRTKERVLPFQFKKWLKIAILLALSGAMSAGSCSLKFPSGSQRPKQQTAQNQTAAPADKAAVPGVSAGPVSAQPGSADIKPVPVQAPAAAKQPMSSKVLAAVISFGSLLLAFLIWFSWYVSPLSLGVYDFLIHGDLGLRGMLERYRSQGNEIFKFGWIFLLALIAGLGGSIALAIIFKNWIVIGLAVLAGVFFLIVCVALFVYWPFIMGAMYLKQLSIVEAFSFVRRGGFSIRQWLFLGLVNAGIGIAAGIVGMLIWLGTALAAAVVLGLPALLVFLVLKSAVPAAILKIAGIIYGGFSLLAAITAVMAFSAPVKLWTTCFNYAFLHRIHPAMQFFNLPRPANP